MSDYRTSYVRRGIGILVFILPFVVVASSIFVQPFTPFTTIATGTACLGLLISTVNFWLSFLRPLLWQRKHAGMKDYRYVSGLPVIGTILAVAAVLIGFGHTLPTLIALAVLLIDSGGLPWFVVWTWKDQSLWDIEAQSTANKTLDTKT